MDYMNATLKAHRKEEEDKMSLSRELELLDLSIVEASQSRLRSILMTVLTTMLGVLPMAIRPGEGSELYAPLGQVIAGGLIATTAVSLFIMPLLYWFLERRKIRKKFRKIEKE